MKLLLQIIVLSVLLCPWILTSPKNLMAQNQDVAAPAGRSTVRGTATYADTGRPMRHTSVMLISDDNGTGQGNTATDGRGQFRFKNVAAGRYILYIDAPGILRPTSYQRNMSSVTSQIRLIEKRDLFAEVVVNGTDGVEVNVQGVRGGVITGRVLTEDDQPLADAEIKLLKRVNDKWLPVLHTWRESSSNKHLRKTDPSGVYRIAGLESGDYLIRVSESDIDHDRFPHGEDAYSNGKLMAAYYPSATNMNEAQAVTVVEGSESTGIDVRIPERIPRTISGTVTYGPDDQPAGYIGITIERREEVGFISVLETTVRGDNEGKWAVNGIPAGEYVLTFSGTVRVGTPETRGHVDIGTKQVAITVANEDVVVNTRVAAGAVVTGTIKIDGPPPQTFYHFSPGVVSAKGSERPPFIQDPRSNRDFGFGYVRDAGRFEIKELSTGKYWFMMSVSEPDRYYVKSVTRKGVDLAQNPFTVNAGAVFDGVFVTLGMDLATIEGQLSDFKPKTSRRVVIVTLAPANEATRRFSSGLVTTHPDAEGRFVFTCGPGEYLVTVVNGTERRATVKAGEKIKIRL